MVSALYLRCTQAGVAGRNLGPKSSLCLYSLKTSFGLIHSRPYPVSLQKSPSQPLLDCPPPSCIGADALASTVEELPPVLTRRGLLCWSPRTRALPLSLWGKGDLYLNTQAPISPGALVPRPIDPVISQGHLYSQCLPPPQLLLSVQLVANLFSLCPVLLIPGEHLAQLFPQG